MGMFYRTVRMVDNGIKPVYVFDGKPPTLKSGEVRENFAMSPLFLTRFFCSSLRSEKRAKMKPRRVSKRPTRRVRPDTASLAPPLLLTDVWLGTAEEVARFTKRTVRVTQEHNDECKKLLKLMGIPYVEAPCEAEAQCAELARAGKVYAAASEDMDTLTFRSPTLLRHLTFSEARKMPIDEVNLEKALTGLDMPYEQVQTEMQEKCGKTEGRLMNKPDTVCGSVYPARM